MEAAAFIGNFQAKPLHITRVHPEPGTREQLVSCRTNFLQMTDFVFGTFV